METDMPNVGLSIEVSFEGQWQCDHCKSFYPYRKKKCQLFSKADDPLFHRALEFCLDCAKLVADKVKQIVGLWESVKEEAPDVAYSNPDTNPDGIQHGRTLGGEGKEGEDSAGDNSDGAPVDPAQPGLFQGLSVHCQDDEAGPAQA